jgi:phage terminase large subunit-like protein
MLTWDTKCLDWRERLMSGTSLVPDLPLFEAYADKAIRIFNRLKIPDVFGTPTMKESCRYWVYPIVRALFGSFDPATNIRHIVEYFLLIPKKNGKSAIAAAVMVTALVLNLRPEAEFLLISTTKTIANITFKQAAGIIRLDSELSKILQVQNHVKTITNRLTGATLQIKAADTDAITGSKSTGILIDETHEFASQSNAAEVFVEVRGGLAARPDGFLMQITTQSKKKPAGVFKQELETARAVRDGLVKLPLLAVTYELPIELTQNGGWRNEKLWAFVNPNIDLSVRRDFLRDQITKADREGADKLALIASQHFNVEIGRGMNSDGWAGALFWNKSVAPAMTLSDLLDASECAVVGIDGGGMDDLLGLAVLGRKRGTREWLLWTHAWAHKCVLERRKSIAQQLLDYEKDGDLTFVEDDSSQDVRDVVNIILQIEDLGLFPDKKAIGVDPVGITDIADALEDKGFDASIDAGRVIGIRQGWSLNSTVESLARRIARGELVHSGTPMMDWIVGNAKIVKHGNAVSIEKANAGDAKIDPLCATLDAASLMGMNPEAKGQVRPGAWVL